MGRSALLSTISNDQKPSSDRHNPKAQGSTPAEVIGVLQGGARILQKRDGQVSN